MGPQPRREMDPLEVSSRMATSSCLCQELTLLAVWGMLFGSRGENRGWGFLVDGRGQLTTLLPASLQALLSPAGWAEAPLGLGDPAAPSRKAAETGALASCLSVRGGDMSVGV